MDGRIGLDGEETMETDSKYHLYYRYHPEPTYSIDEWHVIYRYIALCLVGQLNPVLDDFWSSYNK
jgi:hypothetical protein